MIATLSDFIPTIPDYTLLRRIGGGSYGDVYLARGITGAFYAVKVVHRSQFDDERPFEREFAGIRNYEPVSRSHDSQVAILHVGANEAEGFFYYVMELADDQKNGRVIHPESYAPRTLTNELKIHGRIAFQDSVRIGLALADAVDHMHRNGLIHRDIKPSNIVFLHGTPRLADPGLVTSVTSTRSFVGTEGYLPPEGPGSVQADIYSLGKVLYEISMGRDRKDYPELPTRLHEFPDHEGLVELNEIILKACHSDRRLRYQNARDMRADLELLNDGQSVIRKNALVRKLGWAKKVGFSALVLGSIGGFGWTQFKQSQETKAAALSQAKLAHVTQLARQGDLAPALAECIDAFQIAKPRDVDEQIWRLRLGALVSQCPRPEASLPHSKNVTEAIYSPNGARIATACADNNIRIWNAQKIADSPITLPHPAPVRAILFSPDSELVATAADNMVHVWRITTRQATSLQLTSQIESLAFNHANSQLAIALGTGVAELRTLSALGDPPLSLPNSGRIHTITFSPDDQLVLIASGVHDSPTLSGEARLFDAQTGQLKATLPHSGPVLFACFSSDGRHILTTSSDSSARLWNTQTGQPTGPAFKHEGPVLCGAFGPSDRWIATAGMDSTLRFWDTHSGTLLRATPKLSSPIRKLALSSDGKLAAAIADGPVVRIWNCDDAQPALAALQHSDRVKAAQFSPDGARLLTACDDRKARIWNLHSPGLVSSFSPIDGAITHADLSPTGNRIAIVQGEPDKGTSLALLQLPSGQSQPLSTPSPSMVLKTAFSSDGKYVAATGLSKTAQVWDATTGQAVTPALEHPHPVWQVRFDPSSKRLLTASSSEHQPSEARVWDIETGRLAFAPLAHDLEVMEAIFSPDGKIIATGSGSADGRGEARLWKSTTGAPLFPPTKLDNGAWLLSFSPDGKHLAGTGMGQTAWIVDVATGQVTIPNLKHDGPVTTLAFSPDSQRLLTAGSDQTIRIWNTATGQSAAPTIKLDASVKDVAFHSNGRIILAACVDGTVSLWDSKDASLILAPQRIGTAAVLASFSKDQTSFVALGQNRGLHTFHVKPCDLPISEIRMALK